MTAAAEQSAPMPRNHDGVLRSARHALGSKSRRLSAMIKRPLALVTRRSMTTAAESSSCGSDAEVEADKHMHQAGADCDDATRTMPTKQAVDTVLSRPATAASTTPVAAPGSSTSSARVRARAPAPVSPDAERASPDASLDTTTPPAKLLDLPQELFDAITKHLSPANIVVLALVNKQLLAMFTGAVAATRPDLVPSPAQHPYTVLGNYINDADRTRSRYRGVLLSTLDMDIPGLVYCYKCRRMHDPLAAFADRLYVPAKSAKCADYDDDSHIPPRATRKMLRAITKHRLRGLDYRPLLQQVNNTSTSCRAGHVVQISLTMRYRDDNMLLRRQQTVASVDKSAHALFLFRTQLLHASRPENSVLLKGIPRLRRPCNHMSWLQVDTWREAVDGLLESLCPNNHDTEHKEHSPSCFSHDRRDLALEPGNMIFGGGIAAAAAAAGRPSTRVLGGGDDDVRGCDRCTTDAHLAVIPLPEPYRWGFALTTWLDVGKIDLSKKWDSHRPDTGQNRDYPRHAEPKGSIARAFECLGPGERFEPKLSELNQARLTNFGSVSAAPGRGSRSGSWTVEHGVDPATGRLLDPDPLTELDY